MKWALALLALAVAPGPASARDLKVCADPNNLPFSNARLEGFENKIVAVVARELHANVTYVWWAQRRGNVRSTLNAGLCDVIPGVASAVDMLATTRPYYKSTYVAVARRGPLASLDSFDDPRLAKARIAVQLIGDDGANTPPAHALMARGLIDNVRGYPVYGDYTSPTPQSPIIDAVARGDVDVAFAWGPTAAYFAKREPTGLTMTPVQPETDGPARPMVFDVSMGVRRTDPDLQRELNLALRARSAEIRAILADYGVPLVDDR